MVRTPLLALALVVAAGAGVAVAAQGGAIPSAVTAPARFGCAPLAVSAGPTVTVGPGQAATLPAVVESAAAGTTILLRNGTYRLEGRGLWFRRPGVTLRSVSGDASTVTLDGGYRTNETVAISASDVTIAHMTITRAVDHLVHVYPSGDAVRGARLYGLRLVDGGEQFVKVNPNAGRTRFVDEGRVECSIFALTDAGRPHVETQGGTSCYTGGIDIHGGRGWTVRLNRFEDIFCRTGRMAEHAVHVWTGSRDTVVENNTIINCARGIGFGLGPSGPGRRYPDDPAEAGRYAGHRGGLIRNNVIYADVPEYDTGIGLEQAEDVRVFHNTVFATGRATGAFSSIDARFANTRAEIRNNLVNNITTRGGAAIVSSHNLDQATADLFIDAAAGDFHLRATAVAAIDRGLVVADAGVDLDGQPHGDRPDIGADEHRPFPSWFLQR